MARINYNIDRRTRRHHQEQYNMRLLKGFAALTVLTIITSITISQMTPQRPAFAEILTPGVEVQSVDDTLTGEELTRWDNFKAKVRQLAPIYDFPVRVALSQAALESARGRSTFSIERKNWFGIAAYTEDPNQAWSFVTDEECIIEYFRLVKKNFPEAYEARNDPERMIRLLVDNSEGKKYATDELYVEKLMSMYEWSEN